jgi:hypothetical protein
MMELLNVLSKANYPARTASYTGTAGNTADWNPGPEGVMIWSTTACYVEIGPGAVATTASTPIPAFTPIPFYIAMGNGAPFRVSAIQIADAGIVYCKPINKQ